MRVKSKEDRVQVSKYRQGAGACWAGVAYAGVIIPWIMPAWMAIPMIAAGSSRQKDIIAAAAVLMMRRQSMRACARCAVVVVMHASYPMRACIGKASASSVRMIARQAVVVVR